MTDWAAKVLAGVPRFSNIGAELMIEAPDGAYIHRPAALAAIAKMAEGDGLVERAEAWAKNLRDERGGYTSWEAKTLLALIAHIAALTAERDRYKAACDNEGKVVVDVAGTMDRISPAQLEAMSAILLNPMIVASETRAEAAEAERDALRAKVARLEGALRPFCFFNEDEPESDVQHAWETRYRDRFSDWIDFADIVAARAALTDGAADE